MAAVQAQLAAQGKRKEKARIAARARRSQEASIIMEMASELEISQEKLRRIDKATIVKLAIDYISSHEKLCNPDTNLPPNEPHFQTGSVKAERMPLPVSAPKSISDQRARAPLATSPARQLNQHLQSVECGHEVDEHDDDDDDDAHENERAGRELGGKLDEHAKENTKKAGKHYRDSDSEEGERLEDTHKLKHQHIGLEREHADEEIEHRKQQHHKQELLKQRHRQPSGEPKRPPLYSMPKLTTASIFAPKTQDNANSYFLMIEAKDNGKAAFVLKPDTEIQDEDDLTHLAPQAGDVSISFETDPLDNIPIDDLLKT